MGNSMLQFAESGRWQGKGVLTQELREAQNTAAQFQALIKEEKQAGRLFSRLKSNDTKLIGQERHSLARELEDILGGLFWLYKLIMRVGNNPFYCQTSDKKHSFVVKFDGINWSAEGHLPDKGLSGAFEEWYNGFLLPQTGSFIKTFGKAWEDGVLEFSEKEELLTCLNGLIFQILKAEKGLKSGSLN